jgi:hypothetical protein
MIDVGDVDGAVDDLIALHHGCVVVVPVPHGVAMATVLLREESTPSPFLIVSSVRVATALLLMCRPGALTESQPLEPLFPSPADTTSWESSFPTTSPSRRSPGRSCHPCPPPHGHPRQAGARWSHHRVTLTPSSVAPSFRAATVLESLEVLPSQSRRNAVVLPASRSHRP